MSNTNPPESLQELLTALSSSIDEDQAEYFSLSEAEADAQLIEEQINPKLALEKVQKALARAKAQAKLDRARAQREKYLAVFERCRQKLEGVTEPVKDDILEIVRGLSPARTEMVEAYFRKFEQSSHKDIKGLKEDLAMLRAMQDQLEPNDHKTESDQG